MIYIRRFSRFEPVALGTMMLPYNVTVKFGRLPLPLFCRHVDFAHDSNYG